MKLEPSTLNLYSPCIFSIQIFLFHHQLKADFLSSEEQIATLSLYFPYISRILISLFPQNFKALSLELAKFIYIDQKIKVEYLKLVEIIYINLQQINFNWNLECFTTYFVSISLTLDHSTQVAIQAIDLAAKHALNQVAKQAINQTTSQCVTIGDCSDWVSHMIISCWYNNHLEYDQVVDLNTYLMFPIHSASYCISLFIFNQMIADHPFLDLEFLNTFVNFLDFMAFLNVFLPFLDSMEILSYLHAFHKVIHQILDLVAFLEIFLSFLQAYLSTFLPFHPFVRVLDHR